MVTTVDDEFELSTWFNSVSDKENGFNGVFAAKSFRERSGDNKRDSRGDAPDPSVCYMCHMPGPEYMSSDKIRKAPSVPVCSEDCEEKYLASKGLRPALKKEKKRKQDEKEEEEDGDADDRDEEEVDYAHCYVCERDGPEYMSTDQMKNFPSVPVCGVECEAVYLKSKHKKKTKKNDKATPPKKAKKENKDSATKRSLSFLEDHLLESDDSKGYKSWWLRALTFYDFVYQRHAMWHSYTYTPDLPNVDPALTKFATWNIYRELDRTTAYLRKSVLRWQKAHQDRRSLREILWMAVVFRFCNKIETFYDVQGIPKSDEFKAFKKRLSSLVKKKPNTEILAGDRDMNVDTYLQTLEDFLDNLDQCTSKVKSCTTIKEIFEALQNFNKNALGSFTCWQVVCDLMELNILPEGVVEGDFIWMTADAKQSLVQIFGQRRARPSEFVSLARILQQRQAQGFKALQVEFPYFMDQKLNLKNIGHALHGYQLYRDIKLYQNNRFVGATAPGKYVSRSVLNDQEPCEICSSDQDDLLLCDLCHRMFHTECDNVVEVPPASWVCHDCKKLSNYQVVGLVETSIKVGATVEPTVISID
uniref:PHD-type domain-containing protein n=1 Tax=Globisporangium ultimum (strain ATCC 200006 / CBS 805.95 / DAOM BR144) TaxID=431595 RepID=K3WK74_GLOUD